MSSEVLAPVYAADLRALTRQYLDGGAPVPDVPPPGGSFARRIANYYNCVSPASVNLQEDADGPVTEAHARAYFESAVGGRLFAIEPMLHLASLDLEREVRISIEERMLRDLTELYDWLPFPLQMLQLVHFSVDELPDHALVAYIDSAWHVINTSSTVGEALRQRPELRIECLRMGASGTLIDYDVGLAELLTDLLILSRAAREDLELSAASAGEYGGSISLALRQRDAQANLVMEAVLPMLLKPPLHKIDVDRDEITSLQTFAASRRPLWQEGVLPSSRRTPPRVVVHTEPQAPAKQEPESAAECPQEPAKTGQEAYRRIREGLEERIIGASRITRALSLVGLAHERGATNQRCLIPVWVDAKWSNLVDTTLFEKVQREIARREADPRNKKRVSKGTFLIRPVCGHCGTEYHGGRLSEKQGNARTYVHAKPGRSADPNVLEAYEKHGCIAWTIRADEIETEIKNLILEERTSETYEAEVRALLDQKTAFERGAADAIEEAEERIRNSETEYRNQVRLLSQAQARGLREEPFFEELERIQQRMDSARDDLEEAQEYSRSRELAWKQLASAIDETRNLGETWDRVGLQERRALLDWWVLDVVVVVEPVPGMKKKNHKSAIVTLRSAPDAPKYFAIRGQAESASTTSSRTHSSSSTASLDTSAPATASVCSEEASPPDTICPSAQAACPRISGSESESEAESTGIAEGDPQLPSATATLRNSPRRLARLTGDPLNRDENSSWDSDINSTSLAPCTPSRGQKAGSSVGTENLCECGQTSWQMSHP